ncbi:hypothetical protein ABBQ32_005030 [Trebouxia sp. C0010 RCD-2024]
MSHTNHIPRRLVAGHKDLRSAQRGSRVQIRRFQRFLNDQGYIPRLKETPDGYTGYFGDLTKEALQAWQEDCHLAADGLFGQSCRQAVARCQEQVQQQHMSQQQGVQVTPCMPGRSVNPGQAAGLAFLLGGVVMFAYQLWAWWRNRQQADAAQRADEVLQDDRDEQLGMWASDGRHSSSASFTYAPHPAAPRGYGRDYAPSASAPAPLVRPASPRHPLVGPISANASQPSVSSVEAVSLDGYPRYTPQWGVGLPEKKQSMPPTPIRREPSDRARAVMARPGSPPYPKTAGGRPKANGSKLRAVPSERSSNRSTAAAAKPSLPHKARPRSPNPTAMPESLTKAPPLKPTLDPSAKSWIQIAVSQRGPSRNGRTGQGAHSQAQTPPGSQGSGVAQILSVEEERQLGLHKNSQNGSSSSAVGNGGNGNGSDEGHASNGGTTKAGVSLFGSYKAPVKQQ